MIIIYVQKDVDNALRCISYDKDNVPCPGVTAPALPEDIFLSFVCQVSSREKSM